MILAPISQRHRRRSLPFPYCKDGLEFDLETYRIDDEEPGTLGLKPGETHVDLTPEGPYGSSDEHQPWREATLSGRLELPEEVVSTVFPPAEREAPPAKMYVAIRCHDTIYRDRSLVSQAPTRAGTYDVSVDLTWSQLRGVVKLRPYLVRTELGDDDSDYAAKPNVRLADGPIFTVLLDNGEREERAFINGEEASFSQTAHLPDGDKLYYLDFRNEAEPKLWINSDNPRITDVLQTDGSVGAEPRMRDVVLDQISYGVWSQLIVRAACAINHDGEVEYEWQRTVVDSFARQLYDEDDLTEAALRLRAEVADGESLPHLMGRIDAELQEYIDPRTQLINLMEEGLQI